MNHSICFRTGLFHHAGAVNCVECCVSHKNNILSSEEPPKAAVFTHLWANYKPLVILAAFVATLKTPLGLPPARKCVKCTLW